MGVKDNAHRGDCAHVIKPCVLLCLHMNFIAKNGLGFSRIVNQWVISCSQPHPLLLDGRVWTTADSMLFILSYQYLVVQRPMTSYLSRFLEFLCLSCSVMLYYKCLSQYWLFVAACGVKLISGRGFIYEIHFEIDGHEEPILT